MVTLLLYVVQIMYRDWKCALLEGSTHRSCSFEIIQGDGFPSKSVLKIKFKIDTSRMKILSLYNANK
jgi:hypothetical protein